MLILKKQLSYSILKREASLFLMLEKRLQWLRKLSNPCWPKVYVLGKDALSQAKAFDESHHFSATAASKVAKLNQKIGLTDKICERVEAIKSVDEKYHISETTKSAVTVTGGAAAATTNTLVNSSYFAKGALWVSGSLNRASKAAADLGNRGVNH